ncbi:hypothetical protein [Ulvibacterium marinum]|uniref:hypothetical protein n=1 Tax=Ulvibacterium marinum TaxID=2419782 RepID=UPI00249527EF|nr:hypothetical protein [Ulvibacterium marinum]
MGSFWQRKYILEVLLAMFIVLVPFSIYIHLYFDDNAQSIHFFGFEYHHDLANNGVFLWSLLTRLIPFLLYIVWFLTNPYWWRYFILAPLVYWIDSLAIDIFVYNEVIENNLLVFSIFINIVIIGLLVIFQKKITRKSETSTVFGLKQNGFTQKYPRLHKVIDKEARFLTEAKQVLPKNEYLRKLMVIKTFIKNSLEHPTTKSGGPRPKKKWDLLMVALLVFTLFLLNSYKFIPENVKEYKVLWYTLHNHGFVDVHTFYWYVCIKLGVFLPMVIWFVTSRDWWRYAILSPIVLIFYQLLEGIAPQKITDEISLFKALPVILAVVCFLGWIAYMVRRKTKILELYDTITHEIEDMLSKIGSNNEMFSEKEAAFKDLKENTKGIQEKKRIDLLMDLREELLKEYALKNRM